MYLVPFDLSSAKYAELVSISITIGNPSNETFLYLEGTTSRNLQFRFVKFSFDSSGCKAFANFSVTTWGKYPSWVVGTVEGLDYTQEMPVKARLWASCDYYFGMTVGTVCTVDS